MNYDGFVLWLFRKTIAERVDTSYKHAVGVYALEKLYIRRRHNVRLGLNHFI